MSNLFVLMPGGRRIGWPLPADVRLGEVSRLRRLAEKRGLTDLADELGKIYQSMAFGKPMQAGLLLDGVSK